MLKIDNNSLYVISNSLKSTFFQILGVLLGIAISIFVSRTLGASTLGLLGIISQITSIAVIVSVFGFNNVVVKEISIAGANKDFKRIADVNFTAIKFTFIKSIFIVIFIVIFAPFLDKYIYPNTGILFPFIIISLSVIPLVITRIYSSSLIGFHKIWQASMFERSLSPVFVSVLLIILWTSKIKITITIIAVVYFIARFVVSLIARYFLIYQSKFNIVGEQILDQLLPMAKPLVVVSVSAILLNSIDILILGYFSDISDVGVFNIAFKVATLNVFLLMAINNSIRPKLAILFKSNKIDEMNKMLALITKVLITVGGFFLLVFIVYGKSILSVWGNEFINGYTPLIVLGIGQLINCGTSVCGQVLVMCGLEKTHRNIDLLILTFHLPISILLCSKYGILGSAVSYMLVISCSNLLKFYYCRKELGLFKFL